MANGDAKVGTEAALAEAVAEANGGAKIDPGADPVDLAQQRMQQLVGNAADKAVEELTQMRDQIDSLMTEIRAGGAKLQADAVDYVRRIKDAIETKVIIANAMAELRAKFGPSQTTITQQKS